LPDEDDSDDEDRDIDDDDSDDDDSDSEGGDEWCSKCGIKYKVSNVQFSVRLKRLKVAGVSDSISTKTGNKRVFKIQEMIKHLKIEIDTEDGVTDDDEL
jgi:hypothetical protein